MWGGGAVMRKRVRKGGMGEKRLGRRREKKERKEVA